MNHYESDDLKMRTDVKLAHDLYNTRIRVNLEDICSKQEIKIITSNPAWYDDTLTKCEDGSGYFHVSTLCKQL